MWCPTPLPEGEQHRRKLRSDKYKPPAGRLLEAYKSDSLVEADEDTDAEAGTDPDAGGAVKSRRRTRSTVRKKSASAVAAAISEVKAAEQKKKKKRKRKVASPPAVATPSILMPRSREVELEEEEEKEKDEAVEELPVPEELPARRSESPAAKRQQELVQKTSEDALRRGLEAQRTAATAQARMPATIMPRVFWPKTRLPTMMR
jgi:actin-related protein